MAWTTQGPVVLEVDSAPALLREMAERGWHAGGRMRRAKCNVTTGKLRRQRRPGGVQARVQALPCATQLRCDRLDLPAPYIVIRRAWQSVARLAAGREAGSCQV
jgi:hypothetical protein